MYENIKGIIFNIQRFSLHDGPGIRTTVFLKGCPLRCLWCRNPESIDPDPELMFDEEKCISCGKCLSICEKGAIKQTNDGKVTIIRELCDVCSACGKVCPSNAIKIVGRIVTVEEVMKEILRDLPFYRNSNGGVTASGGEPLFQPEFTEILFKAAQKEGINTALDTSGYSTWKVFEKILKATDFLLYDLKCMDSERHKKYTGVTNKLILENLVKADKLGLPIFIRVPVVPDANFAGEEDFKNLANFLSRLNNVVRVDLLPYHTLGEAKSRRLGKPFIRFKEPDENFIKRFRGILEDVGLKTSVGGLS